MHNSKFNGFKKSTSVQCIHTVLLCLHTTAIPCKTLLKKGSAFRDIGLKIFLYCSISSALFVLLKKYNVNVSSSIKEDMKKNSSMSLLSQLYKWVTVTKC